jgi:hypothetical protein
MVPNETYIGDVITLNFTVLDPVTRLPVNLALYDSVTVLLAPPGEPASASSNPATLPGGGTDGVCRTVTAPGQLNLAGRWQAQVVGSFLGTPRGHASIWTFDVLDPLTVAA